jgi:uncharacterized heparinase superfamily protein
MILRTFELKEPAHYWKAVNHRLILPWVWRASVRRSMQLLTNAEFVLLFNWSGTDEAFVAAMHAQVRHRFFFHPRNRKDFFLNLLTTTEPHEHILSEAEDVLENRFETLGSGKVSLGSQINWHRDFKSGKEWPVIPSSEIDIIDIEHPSDVKVPWELSRFHQVWWLGKAYWLTGREEYAEKFQSLIEDWIINNPPGCGVNWAIAMEASIRACNWMAGYYFFCESPSCSTAFWLKFFKTMYVHGVFIEHHIEYAWRKGNHYLSNATGMVFLGVFFRQTAFGKRWLTWGVRALHEEMDYEVYPDGVDYEKSVSYHRLVLELFYTPTILCTLNKVSFSKEYSARLQRMFEFVLSYTRPDGSTPNIGDADDGRLFRIISDANIDDHRHALAVGAILFNRSDFKHAAGSFWQDALWMYGAEGFERFQQLREEPKALPSRAFVDGGFYILRSDRMQIFADCGDLGQRGRGGHGHNDTLSFELWMDGFPLIVDSGTYAYTFDQVARQEFRSVRAHNTLAIDGGELSEFDGLWAVKDDRTHPRVLQWLSTEGKDILEAEHQAYEPVVCRRRWELDKSASSLHILDTVEGAGTHTVSSRFHFHPDAQIEQLDPQTIVVKNASARFRIEASAGTWIVEEARYSPSYGVRVRNKRWALSERVELPFSVQVLIRTESI